MNKSFYKKLEISCFILFTTIWCVSLLTDKAVAQNVVRKDAEIAWAQLEGNSYNLYYSAFRDGHWGQAKEISGGNGTNLIPTIAPSAAEGATWVVWPIMTSQEKIDLYYTRVDQNDDHSTPLKMSFGLQESIAPDIVVDEYDSPWVVWSGSTGGVSDVYYSRWKGSDWTSPQRVNEENTVPDILPQVEIDKKGYVRVTWQTVRQSEYVEASKVIGRVLQRNEMISRAQQDDQKCNIELPEAFADLDKATIYVRCSDISLPKGQTWLKGSGRNK